MAAKLTISEKKYLDDFLKTIDKTKISLKFSYLYSAVVSILGLILFTSAVIITLNNLNDRVVYWVLFTGTIGGIGIILLGIYLFKYLKKIEENKEMVVIIKKLLN
jgi:pheromone shutdown protein TraB